MVVPAPKVQAVSQEISEEAVVEFKVEEEAEEESYGYPNEELQALSQVHVPHVGGTLVVCPQGFARLFTQRIEDKAIANDVNQYGNKVDDNIKSIGKEAPDRLTLPMPEPVTLKLE